MESADPRIVRGPDALSAAKEAVGGAEKSCLVPSATYGRSWSDGPVFG